jgi:hypothetical protein
MIAGHNYVLFTPPLKLKRTFYSKTLKAIDFLPLGFPNNCPCRNQKIL